MNKQYYLFYFFCLICFSCLDGGNDGVPSGLSGFLLHGPGAPGVRQGGFLNPVVGEMFSNEIT